MNLVDSVFALNMLQQSKKKVIVEAEIILGNPNLSCAGNGICMLYPRKRYGRIKFACPVISATMMLKQQGIRLIFNSADVQSAALGRHFCGEHFLIEVACALPVVFTSLLQYDGTLVILPGRYLIQKTKSSLIVDLKTTFQFGPVKTS